MGSSGFALSFISLHAIHGAQHIIISFSNKGRSKVNNLIEKVEIANFRSIVRQTIKMDNINILSGSNDTGKTNLLRALNLFFNNRTDFMDEIKFDNDFDKSSLERARKSSKGKQLIRIRVYFKKPKTYRIFSSNEEIFVEKTIDRFLNVTTYTSHDTQVKKKAQISKILSEISYVYIPALKGRDVVDYVLALVSSYDLLQETDIALLNKKIGEKTKILTR